jgi:hypothetical protein
VTTEELFRFIPKVKMDVNHPGDCWEWTARITKKGYGSFRASQSTTGRIAHRISYEHWVGPIKGQIDHLCHNRSCVNPWHLEDVTCQENIARGFGVGSRLKRKSCIKGHWFDAENTWISKEGHRHCITCRDKRVKEFRMRYGRAGKKAFQAKEANNAEKFWKIR